MFEIRVRSIHVARGNTGSITVDYDVNGTLVPFVQGDKVTLTVKASLDGPILIQKVVEEFVDGCAEIEFEQADTKDIYVPENPGYVSYLYDVRIDFANGEVMTLGVPSEFRVIGVVNHE